MSYIGLPALIADIAVATGHSQTVVRSVINNFLLQIEGSRFRPEKPDIRIHGFGRFRFTTTGDRKVRNPKTGETMDIPARRGLRFTPTKALTERIQDKSGEAAPIIVLKKRAGTKR